MVEEEDAKMSKDKFDRPKDNAKKEDKSFPADLPPFKNEHVELTSNGMPGVWACL